MRQDLVVTDKFTNGVATRCAQAGRAAIEQGAHQYTMLCGASTRLTCALTSVAIDAAHRSMPAMLKLQTWERKEILGSLSFVRALGCECLVLACLVC